MNYKQVERDCPSEYCPEFRAVVDVAGIKDLVKFCLRSTDHTTLTSLTSLPETVISCKADSMSRKDETNSEFYEYIHVCFIYYFGCPGKNDRMSCPLCITHFGATGYLAK